jgi:hypothetical protein
MKRTRLFPAALALTVLALVLPAAISAGTAIRTETVPHPQVASVLTEFKRTAFEARREADTLHSFTPSKQMSWQSHAHRLHTLKQQVNDLGKKLAELEALKPLASESQQMAIEHARPHLVVTAQNLTEAIGMINENRRSVHQSDYAEAVRNIYTHTDSLYQKVGTILEYERAKMRLDNLDLQPATSAEGR